MARKNTARKQLVANKSLASDFTTEVTEVTNLDNCSYQIAITTSDSTGSFVVQASNDYNLNVGNTGTWSDLSLGGGTPSVAAANDTILIDLNQLPFTAIRLKYTSSVAGTGVCTITIVGKQLSG